MKKIMLITPMLHQGGFERVCVMTARLLQEDYEVVVVVFSMEDIAFDISGIKVIDLKLPVRKGKLGKLFNILRRCLKLSFLQRRLKTDVSYSFGMSANISNALSFGAKKKIAACHSFEEIKDNSYMKLIGRHADMVVCCSQKMTELTKNLYGFDHVRTLWNPCDIEEILEQSSHTKGEDLMFFRSGHKVLVSMGREDDVKGFWHLLKVFRKIYENEPDSRLAVIGEGNFEEYKKLADELGIRDRVLFTGLKKNPFPYLRLSACYLLTSLSEGLPNALVEALALSLPIVSVNCLSGPAEILNRDWQEAEGKEETYLADFGILTPRLPEKRDFTVTWKDEGKRELLLEKSQEEFAKAVIGLFQDRALYDKYRESALGRARDFSKEAYLKGLVSCIDNL